MLTIDRVQVVCRAPSDHPWPAALVDAVDRIVRHEVPSALATRLGVFDRAEDRRRVLIPRLAVEVGIDVGLDDRLVGAVLADAVARSLASIDLDGPDVVVFHDEVEQVGRFLLDVAAGQAWGRPHHRVAFAGLRHLPDSAAIRTLATTRTVEFVGAVRRLTASGAAAVVGAVGPMDAGLVVDAVGVLAAGGEPGVADLGAAAAAACQVWLDDPWARAGHLGLLVGTLCAAPDLDVGPVVAVVPAVRAVASSRPLLHDVDDRWLDEVVGTALSSAFAAVDRDVLADVVRLGAPVPAVPTAAGGTRGLRSVHGALALLLPYLVESGALTTAGRRRAIISALAGDSALSDPAVVELFALHHDDVEADPLDVVRWLREARAIGDGPAAVRIARAGGRRRTVVLDAGSGHWLGSFEGRGSAVGARRIVAEVGEVPLDGLAPGVRRVADQVANDLRRLGIGSTPDGDALDGALVAENVLRRFATGLPGFATAAIGHVWEQALDAPMEVQTTPSGWTVRVGSVALGELLRICGHAGRTSEPPWTSGRWVAVELVA